MNINKFKYAEKVLIKTKNTDNFYETQKGYVIEMDHKRIPQEATIFYRYLVELDDKFKFRKWFTENELEKL